MVQLGGLFGLFVSQGLVQLFVLFFLHFFDSIMLLGKSSRLNALYNLTHALSGCHFDDLNILNLLEERRHGIGRKSMLAIRTNRVGLFLEFVSRLIKIAVNVVKFFAQFCLNHS